jgi:uncharacterized protein YjbI with pentapeptide repeats
VVVGFLAEAGLIGSVSPRGDFVPPRVDLLGADLRNAPLPHIILSGAVLQGVDLRGADLRYAELLGTKFDFANLRDADFRTALMDRRLASKGTSFSDACVAGARFANADMAGVVFDAVGWDVDFSDATLVAADFRAADLAQAKFDGANTKGTTFPSGEWTPTGFPRKSPNAIERCTSWTPTP